MILIGHFRSNTLIPPRLETLKTRIMSSKSVLSPSAPTSTPSNSSNSLIMSTAKQMYRTGGIRAFWPGLVSYLKADRIMRRNDAY